MKQFISVIVLLLVTCFMFVGCTEDRQYEANVASGDIAKFTLFTYDGKGESVWGLANLGHTFLSIENISQDTITIGKKDLNVGETIALGTWSIKEHFGVWYNVESNYIAEHNKYDGRVSITIGITAEDLEKINHAILSNDRWNPLNNCSHFALHVYNQVASDTEYIKTPLIHTPSYIAKNIKKFANHEYNKAIPTDKHLGFFRNSEFVSYNLEKAVGV